jgi:hypothetical protein
MVLFLALGIMLVLLSLGVMFAGVSISRTTITNNQRDAIKARCIAESGIADALAQLADDPGNRSDIGATSFGGGSYKVDIDSMGDTEVLLTSTAKYDDAYYRTRVRVQVPPSTGSVYTWALRLGDSEGAWNDGREAHDDAQGANGCFAWMRFRITDEHGLGGFRLEPVPYPITDVEMVIDYYLPQAVKDGDLELRWRRVSDDKKGPWQKAHYDVVNQALSTGGHGVIVLDAGSSPSGVWTWEIFESPTFQIDVKTHNMDAYDSLTDTFLVDCVGFKISW